MQATGLLGLGSFLMKPQQKFFYECSRGDQSVKVLALKCFVPYGIYGIPRSIHIMLLRLSLCTCLHYSSIIFSIVDRN